MPDYTANLRLLRTLQFLFHQQAREVLAKLTWEKIERGEIPDLTHWVSIIANAARPVMTQYWQAGMLRSEERVRRLLAGERPEEDMRRHMVPVGDIFASQKGVMWSAESLCELHYLRNEPSSRTVFRVDAAGPASWWRQLAKAGRNVLRPGIVRPVAVDIRSRWNLLQPAVLDAVDAATMQFCRETNETAVIELGKAIKELRGKLKEGLSRGDAVATLAKTVRQIFAEPSRAFRIATTETSRAMHGGALMAAKANPAVKKKQWLASTDSCSQCSKLDGMQRDLGEPFWVDPKGGSYAVILFPPLHPHCLCDFTEVI